MIIGVPRETMADEYRVAMTPSGCEILCADGHEVLIEAGAGEGAGFGDEQYRGHGAAVVDTAEEVFERSGLIVKVKEPLPGEWPKICDGQVVFTFFHFAASRELTEGMISTGATAIAYETITDDAGRLPLLRPMSEVAGRMSVQMGAWSLERHVGGRGVLMGGVPGTPRASVMIIGGGTVGAQAAKVAAGMGARVTVLDIDLDRLRYLDDILPANAQTLMSSPANMRNLLGKADLVIGAVLIPGGRTPMLIKREDLKLMQPGSVLVDVAVDQGGCAETTRPTTHHEPTYIVDGVVHYCVTNIPGAVPRTSTIAMTNATLPYVHKIAAAGWREASADPHIAAGVNVVAGTVTCPAVAEAHGMQCTPLRI